MSKKYCFLIYSDPSSRAKEGEGSKPGITGQIFIRSNGISVSKPVYMELIQMIRITMSAIQYKVQDGHCWVGLVFLSLPLVRSLDHQILSHAHKYQRNNLLE